MSALKTDYKDDILAESMNGQRRYHMITNDDGTVSFIDASEYEQVGSDFGAGDINNANSVVNELNRKLTPQYIRVAVNDRPTISSGSKIPFNSAYNHSDCFAFDGNGTITVLEDCVVRVSAVIGGQPTDSNNMRGYFWLNKNSVNQVNTITYGSFVSCPFDTIIEVSQGDTIYIYTMEEFKPSTGGVSCYCCIEKLG